MEFMSATATPRLFTVDELAAWLQLHPVTVRRLIASGDLRVVRFGRSIRIAEDEVARFVSSREVPQ
jgi:excisionase family DNA binding protein